MRVAGAEQELKAPLARELCSILDGYQREPRRGASIVVRYDYYGRVVASDTTPR